METYQRWTIVHTRLHNTLNCTMQTLNRITNTTICIIGLGKGCFGKVMLLRRDAYSIFPFTEPMRVQAVPVEEVTVMVSVPEKE